MSKGDHVEMLGTVTEAQAAGIFRVKIDESNTVIVAKLAGKMRQSKIRVTVGDRVRIALSPYDLSNGLITWRQD